MGGTSMQRSRSEGPRSTRFEGDEAGQRQRLQCSKRTSGGGMLLPHQSDEWTLGKPRRHALFSDGFSPQTHKIILQHHEQTLRMENSTDCEGSPGRARMRAISADGAAGRQRAGIDSDEINTRIFRSRYGTSHLDSKEEGIAEGRTAASTSPPPRYKRPADDAARHQTEGQRAAWLLRTDVEGFQ